MNLLHVSASPRGSLSHSRWFGRAVVDRLRAATAIRVTRRDLAATPPPAPDAGFVEASLMRAQDRGAEHRHYLEVSENLIAELAEADAAVIDMPMHNFTVPAVFKAWIDMVVRPGRTFDSTPSGKVALLADRPVVVIAACGGSIGRSPFSQPDFLTPYVKHVFATMGLNDLTFVLMERLNRGGPAVAQARASAMARLGVIASHMLARVDRRETV